MLVVYNSFQLKRYSHRQFYTIHIFVFSVDMILLNSATMFMMAMFPVVGGGGVGGTKIRPVRGKSEKKVITMAYACMAENRGHYQEEDTISVHNNKHLWYATLNWFYFRRHVPHLTTPPPLHRLS